MVNVSILLLALSFIAVAISVIILGKRVSALEKEFKFKPSIKSLKAANEIQSFLERARNLHPYDGSLAGMPFSYPCAEEDHSRPCAEDDHSCPCAEDDHSRPCVEDEFSRL